MKLPTGYVFWSSHHADDGYLRDIIYYIPGIIYYSLDPTGLINLTPNSDPPIILVPDLKPNV